MTKKTSALVVLSGGQDSTTCLFWAKSNYERVETITFDYGQRHRIEIECAKKIAEMAGTSFQLVPIDSFKYLGSNSLVGTSIPVKNELETDGLPNTFVPGRNLIFLTFAAAFAYQRGISDIVTGVCQTDYSGYPDCRENTMQALQNSISLGMDYSFRIITPLMYLTKAESILLAKKVGALDALAYTHTCYNGVFPPCKICPSCKIREKGFSDAKILDPLLSRND